jgi:hypothetical protein
MLGRTSGREGTRQGKQGNCLVGSRGSHIHGVGSNAAAFPLNFVEFHQGGLGQVVTDFDHLFLQGLNRRNQVLENCVR